MCESELASAVKAPLASLRFVVRAANAAPKVLGIQINGVNGIQIADTPDASQPLQLHATEGVPLKLDLYARDADLDLKVRGIDKAGKVQESPPLLARLTRSFPDGAKGLHTVEVEVKRG